MNLLALIKATRPKTLPAGIVPVWLGCILAWKLEAKFELWLMFCTLFGALFIQISTNLFNDAIDAQNGADTEARLGPKRMTATGELNQRTVSVAALVCLGISSIFGVFLFLERGWVMLLIGLPSFYFAYGYTGGPFPLAYKGMGEAFVLLFFGWIAVMGTVFVQTGKWYEEAFLLGTQVGFLSAMMVLVNNIRDRAEDCRSKKNTIVVLLGARPALVILWTLMLCAHLLGSFWIFFGFSLLSLIPPLASMFGFLCCFGIAKQVRQSGTDYQKYIAVTALQLLLFAGLWTLTILVF
jgi:1,4-dihydroxy-2-naphthoate polyprenyltransferase